LIFLTALLADPVENYAEIVAVKNDAMEIEIPRV
jgi:hypothetical protein